MYVSEYRKERQIWQVHVALACKWKIKKVHHNKRPAKTWHFQATETLIATSLPTTLPPNLGWKQTSQLINFAVSPPAVVLLIFLLFHLFIFKTFKSLFSRVKIVFQYFEGISIQLQKNHIILHVCTYCKGGRETAVFPVPILFCFVFGFSPPPTHTHTSGEKQGEYKHSCITSENSVIKCKHYRRRPVMTLY